MTAVTKVRRIHPFPARMAPDLALDKIKELTAPGDVVLDPMCGSGTVPYQARELGRRALASDLDPLSVMMTRTLCRPSCLSDLASRATAVVERARAHSTALPAWIAQDPETRTFVEYWFAQGQRDSISRLAKVLAAMPSRDDGLRIALSRTIVTKDGGASLARDTSHSRPHRTRTESAYDVDTAFIASAKRLEALADEASRPRALVRGNDARALTFVGRESVDLALTSPPYLNAIDYMRGHRLSLVWFGYALAELRHVRGTSVGAERAATFPSSWATSLATEAVDSHNRLSNRDRGMVVRYVDDMRRVGRSMSRVVRPGGHLVLVVANSQRRGVKIDSALICRRAAEAAGFVLVDEGSRKIPSAHRYLPPPESGASALTSRMKVEMVLTMQRRLPPSR